jgi:acyl-CoA reductase-like NAD-dependent aldehyde dehydrogenase
VELLPAVQSFIAGPKQLLIGGRHVDAEAGGTFETTDPATGEVITSVAAATEREVHRAVESSREALRGPWSRMGAHDRERVLHRLAELIESHGEELAQLDSLDSGKPFRQIEAVDVQLAIGQFHYYAGWVTKIEGATLPVLMPDTHVTTRREPVGVVGAIVPWNFPLCQAAFKLAPALAAGCTVILKPAEQTPLSGIRLGELALEAGIPEGVVNVVTGFGTAGAALVEHPGVDKIAFTGSEEVGKEIARRGAATLKHVSLELGGKNPNIVFADADVEQAAVAAATTAFFYTGQVCAAGSRLMVDRTVYDEVVAAVVEEAGKLQLGPGLAEETTLGPLVSEEQRRRVIGFLEGAAADGATVATGGNIPNGPLAGGWFHEPTVITDVSDDHAIVRHEVFGPVVVVQPFESVEEVAARANHSSFGLAAGVWTKDLRKAHALADALEAGTVWVNTYSVFDAVAPWGGYKQSGYGRDGGREGIEKYLQTKTVWTNFG